MQSGARFPLGRAGVTLGDAPLGERSNEDCHEPAARPFRKCDEPVTAPASGESRDAAVPGEGDRGARTLGWAALLAVLCFAVFWPAYAIDYDQHAGFVWDDDDHYLNDHLVNSDDDWWRIWFDPQPGVVRASDGAWVWNYWPLTRSSFWVDRHLFGTWEDGRPNLLASHLINVALHAANAILLLFALRRLRVAGAELAALFFVLHPVTVESVAWITERKNLLSTFFFLTALWSWLRFRDTPSPRGYLATTGAFLLALMGKTSTVMFPVVLVLIHWYRREPWSVRSLARLAPFFAMSLVAGVTSILFERLFIDAGQASPVSGWPERVAVSGHIAWFYFAKDLLPIGLAFNYPRWQIDPAAWKSYLPTLSAIAVLAGLWLQREGWARPFVLALASFGALLFPVLGFLDLYGMRYAHVADHWQYLACIPVIALAAGLLETQTRNRLALRVVISAFVVTGFAWLSFTHAGAYVDDEALFADTLERQPGSVLANNNFGNRLLAQRRYEESIPYFERAIESGATIAAPYVNMGVATEMVTGNLAEGAYWYGRALELDPEQPQALHYLAVERLAASRPEEAEALLRRALDAHPTYLAGLELLAQVLRDEGRSVEIFPLLERAKEPVASQVAGGRELMLGVWGAMTLALLGAAAVSYEVSRSNA